MASSCDTLGNAESGVGALDVAAQAHQSGDWVEAARLYRQFLERQPNDPAALQRLGRLCHDVGNDVEAIDLISNAIAHVTDAASQADCRVDLAAALLSEGLAVDALAACEQARDAIEADDVAIPPRLFLLQSDAFARLEQPVEAIGVLGEAAAAYPDDCEIRVAHAHALESEGEIDKAVGEFEAVLERQPHHVEAVLYLTELMLRGFVSIGTPWINRIRMTIPYSADDRLRIGLRFALGDVHRRRGEQAEADAAYRHANRDQFHKMTSRRGVMTVERLASFVDTQIAYFTPQLVEDLQRRYGTANTQPLFVVGLPGTDPLAWVRRESRNTDIVVWENAPQFAAFAERVVGQGSYPEACRDAPSARWNAARAQYLDAMRPVARYADHVANPISLNSLYVGLIAILFPSARIVHCVRETEQAITRYYRQPRVDDCLATADLPSVRQASEHLDRLMQHWKMVVKLETAIQ